MKVRELAQELGIELSQLLKTLSALGIKGKSAASTLDEESLKLVRAKLKSSARAKAKEMNIKKPQLRKTAKPVKVAQEKLASVAAKKIKKAKAPTAKVSVKAKKEVLAVVTPTPPVIEPKIKVEPKPRIVVEALKPKVSPKPVAAKVIAEKKEPKPVEKKEPVVEKKREEPPKLVEVEIELPVSVKDLSVKLSQKASALLKRLLEKKMIVNLNQSLTDEVAKDLARDFGFELKSAPSTEDKLLAEYFVSAPENLKHRYPVVTLMGHVDHGKTSILDYIRKSKLADQEHGGITQHIGAYGVTLKKGRITFLDTPGHEAFTAMRARGANVTDIVVLVVAADDGIMPQTIEAIDHAKAANVAIMVAINKVDKAPENVDNVKRQLVKYGLTPEGLGGKTVTVPVSAKTGEGIDELLELIVLQSELLELKADFSKPASGVVIEANLSKGRGVETTVLVQQGILHLGDIILVEDHFGKIKAMFNSLNRPVSEAEPSLAVKVLGLSEVPQAGEKFFVVNDEKLVKEIAAKRKELKKKQRNVAKPHITLEDLHKRIQEGAVKELKIILKADVQGSLGALENSLGQLSTEEVKIATIHTGVGEINASDVVLAAASDAIIIGFHVEPDSKVKELAEKEAVEVRTYRIIYEAIADLKAALEGLLEPTIKRKLVGRVLVKKIFDLSRCGKVAGCFVQKGKINRSNIIVLMRNEEKIYEGKLANLKRFKDDVREVNESTECGITLSGFTDIQEGDYLEAFEEERIARKL